MISVNVQFDPYTFEPIDIFVDDVNDADEDADPAPGDAQFKLTVVLIEAGG